MPKPKEVSTDKRLSRAASEALRLMHFPDAMVAKEVNLTRERVRQLRALYNIPKSPLFRVHCKTRLDDESIDRDILTAYYTYPGLCATLVANILGKYKVVTVRYRMQQLGLTTKDSRRDSKWLVFCEFCRAQNSNKWRRGELSALSISLGIVEPQLHRWKQAYYKLLGPWEQKRNTYLKSGGKEIK